MWTAVLEKLEKKANKSAAKQNKSEKKKKSKVNGNGKGKIKGKNNVKTAPPADRPAARS